MRFLKEQLELLQLKYAFNSLYEILTERSLNHSSFKASLSILFMRFLSSSPHLHSTSTLLSILFMRFRPL